MKRIINGVIILLFTILISITNIPNLLASSATISVSSSSSKVVVGNSFTVTIKISSSSPIGAWNFTPSYDKSILKLTSGTTPVTDYGDGSIKSKSYTYKFKAIASGSSKITVKSYQILDYKTEEKMSISLSTKTIKVITSSELKASYSKNNNLKSLSIDGLKLNPNFDKNTTKYTANADANTTKINIKANTEDSKSDIDGTGKKDVIEGENKFDIVVTAQNGDKKTYTIIVNVTDPNPIEVTIDNETYTIIKRESNIPKIDGYTLKEIEIQNQKVPSLYNEQNNITLLSLKNKDSQIFNYKYDETNNTYTLYNDITLSQIRIIPQDIDKKINDYLSEEIEINNIKIKSLKVNDNTNIIKAINFNTSKEEYYYYDKLNKTIIKYFEIKKEDNKEKEINQYKKIIMLLGIETIIIIFILICILIAKVRKNNKRKKYLQEKMKEEKERQREVQELKDQIKKLEKKNNTTSIKNDKKEASKNEKEKK